MTAIPTIEIFVRHSADCAHADDERYKGCKCRKHLRWSFQGKQFRRKAGTRSWKHAERVKREIELQYEAAESKQPIEQEKPATVEQAITAFMAEKVGGQKAKPTLAKYRLT